MNASTPVLAPGRVVIVLGCSQRKLVTTQPVAALELYQGACIPHARAHFADTPRRRARLRILSAAHGLLGPDDPVGTYERALRTPAQAARLGTVLVADQVRTLLAAHPGPTHALVVAEPLYLVALCTLLDGVRNTAVVTDPRDWELALTHLRCWGWA